MIEPRNPLTAELGQRVRRIRVSVGLTGVELAQLADVTQPTVSKVERGRVVPSPDLLDRLLEALCVDPPTRHDLFALLGRAAVYTAAHRGKGRGLLMHGAIVEREGVAREVRCFQQAMVPALLQTAEYARHVATITPWLADDEGATVAASHIVRQSVLYQPDRRFEFVITESALRSGPKAASLMRAQLDRLTTLGTLGNVRIGVIPWESEPRLLPWCGFSVFDRTATSVLTYAGETVSSDPADVDLHLDAFRVFADAALFGPAARVVLARVIGDLSRKPSRGGGIPT